MDKVKPYTFWIVTGIILLAELIYFGFILTPENPNKPGYTVEDAKEQADSKFRTLKNQYHTKAKANIAAGERLPKTPIRPEDAKAVDKQFLDTFLIHPEWEATFEQVVQAYQEQIEAIRQDLAQRSQPLNEPVSQQQQVGLWYEEYIKATIAALTQMYEAKKADFPVVTGPEGVPVAPDKDDWENKANLRDVMGFYTSRGSIPTQSQWRELTQRFRVIEIVAEQVRAVSVVPPPNPRTERVEAEAVQRPSAEAPRGVVLRDISWGRESDQKVGLPGAPEAFLQPFSVQVRGHPAALLEFSSRLEAISSPIILRTGARWKRLPRSEGSLLGKDGEEMLLTIDLVYADFSRAR